MIVFIFIILLTFGESYANSPIFSDESVVRVEPQNLSDYQIVYYSTRFFSHPLIKSVTSKNFVFACREQYPKCLITSYKGHADKADATFVHWWDYVRTTHRWDHKNSKIGHSTRPNMLVNYESPENIEPLPEHAGFHLVATYRRDSDIYLPYGKVTKLRVPTKEFDGMDFSANKTLPAAWFASNCNQSKGAANRLKYIRKLQNYIQVDIYGKCGKLKCKDNRSTGNYQCLSIASKKYYFYLAFENSIFKDYVTEKFFNLANHTMIPIVYGGANYTEFLPPNSFINARDYSPKQLAQLMKELMADKDRYNQYFRWKSDYVMQNGIFLGSAFCQACSLAYIANLKPIAPPVYSLKSAKTINDWFFGTSKDSL